MLLRGPAPRAVVKVGHGGHHAHVSERLPRCDAEWRAVADLLTTCSSMLHEPREDVALIGHLVRPARRPVVVGQRDLTTRVRPATWEIGDWIHTWWGYPFHGTLVEGCLCSAHTPEASVVHFGPGVRASA